MVMVGVVTGGTDGGDAAKAGVSSWRSGTSYMESWGGMLAVGIGGMGECGCDAKTVMVATGNERGTSEAEGNGKDRR